MGNSAGVKRNFDLLEERRMQAATLLRQGIHEAEVARRIGVHRQSVNRWARQLSESGVSGLKKAGHAGRRPFLTASNLKNIRRILNRGAAALGYDNDFWTTRRVGDVIERECGVRYHANHVGKVLRKLGWSCKWLILRASNRGEETTPRGRGKKRTKNGRNAVGGSNTRMRQREQFVRVIAWLPDPVLLGAGSGKAAVPPARRKSG